MTGGAALLGLFLWAFLAATLVPASSEAALAALVASDQFSPWSLIGAAALGNILGASVNWAIGRYAAQTRLVSGSKRLRLGLDWFSRWGAWSLLLSWAPIVGDPLTFAAGLSRMSWWTFLPPVAIGKIGRYVGVYWLTATLF